MIQPHPLLYVFASCYLWFKSYRYLCVWNTWPKEWNCRILAAVHAVLLTSLSLYCAYVVGPWPFDHPGGSSTLLQELILSLSLGYFIFDLLWCLSHKTEGAVMLIHHVASILSILYCVYYRESGTEMVAAIGGAEITNPLLQLRWFLKEQGYKFHGIPMTLVEYTFTISFFLVRGVVGSYFLYCVVISPQPSLFVKAGGISIFFISAIFAYAIACYMWKKRIKDYFCNETDEPIDKTKDIFETPIEETKFVNENGTLQSENSKSR